MSHRSSEWKYVTQPLHHEPDATEGQFFKTKFNGFEIKFLLFDWLPYQC